MIIKVGTNSTYLSQGNIFPGYISNNYPWLSRAYRDKLRDYYDLTTQNLKEFLEVTKSTVNSLTDYNNCMKRMYKTAVINPPHSNSEKLLVDLDEINKNYLSTIGDNSIEIKPCERKNKETYEKDVKEFIRKIISMNKQVPLNSTAGVSTKDANAVDINDTEMAIIKTNMANVKSNAPHLQHENTFGLGGNETNIGRSSESAKNKILIDGKNRISNKANGEYKNPTIANIVDTPVILRRNSKIKNGDIGKLIGINYKVDDILGNLARNMKIKESIQISNLNKMETIKEGIKTWNSRQKNDTFNSNSKLVNTSNNNPTMQNNITSIFKRDLKQFMKKTNHSKSNHKIDFQQNGINEKLKNNLKLHNIKKLLNDNSQGILNMTFPNNATLKHILELSDKYQLKMKSKNKNISVKNESNNYIGIIDAYNLKNKTSNSNHKSTEKKSNNMGDLVIEISKNISFSNYNKTRNDNSLYNTYIKNNTIIILSKLNPNQENTQNKKVKFNYNSKPKNGTNPITLMNKNTTQSKISHNNFGNEKIMYMSIKNKTFNNFSSNFNPETISPYNNESVNNNNTISILSMINYTHQELTSQIGKNYNRLQNSFTNNLEQGNTPKIPSQLKDIEKDKIQIPAHIITQPTNQTVSQNNILGSEENGAENNLNSNTNEESLTNHEFDLFFLINRIKINPNESNSITIAYNVLHYNKNQTELKLVSDTISEKFNLIDERMAGRKSKIDVKSFNVPQTKNNFANSTSFNENKVNEIKLKYQTTYNEIMKAIQEQIEETKKIIAREIDQNYLAYYKKMLRNLNNIFKEFKSEYRLSEKSQIEDFIKQFKMIKVFRQIEAEGYNIMEKTIKLSIEIFDLLDKLIVTDLDSLWKYIDTIKVNALEITDEVVYKISTAEFINALNTHLQNLKKIKIKIDEIKKSPNFKQEFRSDVLTSFLTVYENYLNWIKSNKTAKATHIEDVKALLSSTENLKLSGDMDVYKLINNDIYDRYINIGDKIIKIITKFDTKLIFEKKSAKQVELDKLKNSTSIKSINSNKLVTSNSGAVSSQVKVNNALVTPEPGPASSQAKVNKTNDNNNSTAINYIIVVTYWLLYYAFATILTIVGYKCMKKILVQSIAFMLYQNHDEISLFNITLVITILIVNSLLGFLVGYFFIYKDLVIDLLLAINGLFIGAAILFNGNSGQSYAYPSFIMLGTLYGLRESAGQTIWIRLEFIVVFIIGFYFLGSFIGNFSFIPYKSKLEIRQPRNKKDFENNLPPQQPRAIALPAQINNI